MKFWKGFGDMPTGEMTEEQQELLESVADSFSRLHHHRRHFRDYDWKVFLNWQPLAVGTFYQRFDNSGLS